MSAVQQGTKNSNAITLRGSSQIISEYLNFGMNSILFQRGIYPPEGFTSTQQYGLTIFMSTDKKIEEFLKNVLAKVQEWLSKNLLEKVSMIITNVHTKEVLECWDFKVQCDVTELKENSDATELKENSDPKNPTSNKDLKRVQNEIRDVMRQISATVSYLPLLDCICSFDILIYTLKDCDIPETWNEHEAVFIQNSQAVQLRSFSTGLHKVDTIVNYKMS